MIRELLRPANVVTSLSLFCGVYSIVLSAGASPSDSATFQAAAVAILFAALFDAIDGRVARMTGGGTDFGVQLDSLVDLVSFGVAPGVLLYKWGLESMGLLGFVTAFAFILAGAFRLARFNLRVEQGREQNDRSVGVPITFAGGMVAWMVMYHHQSMGGAVSVHLPVIVFALFLAYLMMCNIRFLAFKDVAASPRGMGVAILLVLAIIGGSAFYQLTFIPLAMGTAYIATGLLGEILVFSKRRHADDIMYLGTLDGDDDFESDEPLEDIIETLAPEHSGPIRRALGRLRRDR